MKQVQRVYELGGDKESNQIGIYPKRSGIILGRTVNNLDVYLPEYFKMLHVGGGGDLVFLTPENLPACLFALPDGAFIVAHGYAVLSSGVINGETVNTTCTLITWWGGE